MAESKDYTIITNNPLVREKLKDTGDVIYLDVSYSGILKAARDRIYEGCRLLSHPLAGNIRPGKMPYRSVMVSAKEEGTDTGSVKIIENAIGFCGGCKERPERYPLEAMNDFQLIDMELLKSAAEAAGYQAD